MKAVFHHGSGGVGFSARTPRLIFAIVAHVPFWVAVSNPSMEDKMKSRVYQVVAALGLAFFSISVVQAQFNYITANNEITITGYTGPGGDVTIPDTINGLPVTSIGDSAFSNCTNLTSVSIPKSVTSIGDDAFHNCHRLTNVHDHQ
jgi:hypothetical protein